MKFIQAAVATAMILSSTVEAQQRPAIALTGEFHGDEVRTKAGERWLALTPTFDGDVLVPVTVTVEEIEDPIVDRAGEKSGRRVTAIGVDEVIVLLRGRAITAGPVRTAEILFDEPSGDGDPAAACTIRFESKEWRLITDRRRATDGREEIRVILSSGGDSQVLATDHDSELAANLIWAGDLDRDGKLDLLLDVSNHYNVSIPTLFLSSAAGKRHLLAAVAEYVITGC
jgi:hypothetical protein